jgi:hypothetical protein
VEEKNSHTLWVGIFVCDGGRSFLFVLTATHGLLSSYHISCGLQVFSVSEKMETHREN